MTGNFLLDGVVYQLLLDPIRDALVLLVLLALFSGGREKANARDCQKEKKRKEKKRRRAAKETSARFKDELMDLMDREHIRRK